jgi:hypothetical protein
MAVPSGRLAKDTFDISQSPKSAARSANDRLEKWAATEQRMGSRPRETRLALARARAPIHLLEIKPLPRFQAAMDSMAT